MVEGTSEMTIPQGSIDSLRESCELIGNEQAHLIINTLNSSLNARNWVARNFSVRVSNSLNQNFIYTKNDLLEVFSKWGVSIPNIGKAGKAEIRQVIDFLRLQETIGND